MATAAGTAEGTLVVNAEVVSACKVSDGATIAFGDVNRSAGHGNDGDSGTTFKVSCSSDLTPSIYATGTRTVVKGTDILPFDLSLTSGAATDALGVGRRRGTGIAGFHE